MVEREAMVREGAAADRGGDLQPPQGRGWPLGIDATTRFATGNYEEPLTEIGTGDRLSLQHPHQHQALPPGPIDSPGLASIKAAAHPAKVDYLYYVVKPGACGEHFLLLDRGRIRSRRRGPLATKPAKPPAANRRTPASRPVGSAATMGR